MAKLNTFDLSFKDTRARLSGAGQGGPGGGNQGDGIGGGGGSPGGGTPGGGGGGGGGSGGGKPGGEGVGNNLSFPAVFPGVAPALRGNPTTFTFTTPTYLAGDSTYAYFAQGVDGNEWQAGSLTGSPVVVDVVDIGDALESAPIQQGRNVRLELTMYQDLLNEDLGEPLSDPLTAFGMTLLGGAKGGGMPTTKGPTESQGARLGQDAFTSLPFNGTTATAPAGTTYLSNFASVYGATSSGGEVTDSYMKLSIQKVTGLDPAYVGDSEPDFLTGITWSGSEWVSGGDITVGDNITNTAFGPELNIAGKYIMGASGKPWKFTADGTYLVTFAIENGAPISFDGATAVKNDDATIDGFQPADLLEGRYTQVVGDGLFGSGGADTHNGLLAMLVGVPSTVGGGGETVPLA